MIRAEASALAEPIPTKTRPFLILCVCITWALLYAHGLSKVRTPGDDNLYLQSIAVSAKSPSRLTALNQELIDGLERLDYDDFSLYRIVLRTKYADNYWAASNIQDVVAALFPVDPSAGTQAYHAIVATRAVLGPAAVGLICLAALATGLFSIRDSRLFVAAIIGISATAALFNSAAQMDMQAILPHIPERTPDNMSWMAAFGRAAYFFVDPGPEFAMFGITPRSNFAVLSFLAAIMRWDNRPASSYLLLAVAIPFHASSGLIMLTLFIASNLAFRPMEIARPMPLIAIVICIALELSQESLGSLLGFHWGIVLIGSLVALSLFAFGLYVTLRTFRFDVWRCIVFLNSTFPNRVVADLVIFLFFWNATLAMVLGRLGYLDYTSVVYLWSQFHTRTAAILQPILITAIAFLMLGAVGGVRNRTIVVLSLGLMFAGCLRNPPSLADPRPEFVQNLAKLEARRTSALPYTKTPSANDESLWYYSILRCLDFNEHLVGFVKS